MKKFFIGPFVSAKPNEQLGRDIKTASKELSDRMSEISRDEIKARDRVDISLEEYERMKEEIRFLRAENAKFREIYESMKIPADLDIIPDSIEVEYSYDHRWMRTRYRIMFDVDGRISVDI